jgi:2-methylcitrate dehydratase PrpD
MGLSSAVADHVATTTVVPTAVLRATARSLLDAVGVSLGASGTAEGCPAFVRLAEEHHGSGSSRVLGTPFRVAPSLAALVNGAFAHALDYEDAHDVAMVHPHAAPVATALAVSDVLTRRHPPRVVSGPALLTAVAIGADLVCRLGLMLTQAVDERGWYPPPILGALGAAATAAHLLELPAPKVRDALSLVTCQATCFGELKRSPRSDVRAVRDAFAAQGGLLAGLLAAEGVRGFDRPLEGEAGVIAQYAGRSIDPSPLLEGLGERFLGTEVSFKPWPSCRGTHAFVHAALSLREELGDQLPVSVVLTGGPANLMLVEPAAQKVEPATAIDAKFSLPFCVASALVRGRLELTDFGPVARRDPEVLALARRVTYQLKAGAAAGSAWARVTARLASGATLERVVDRVPGHPELPLDDQRLADKFVACAGLAAWPLEEEQARRLAGGLLDMFGEPDALAVFDWVVDDWPPGRVAETRAPASPGAER